MYFYQEGAISERTFQNKNISRNESYSFSIFYSVFSAAKKYYQRRGASGSVFKEDADEYSFFSNEEDDDFFSEDEEDDGFWDD